MGNRPDQLHHKRPGIRIVNSCGRYASGAAWGTRWPKERDRYGGMIVLTAVEPLAEKIANAHCILLGTPVYNYDASAAAKNMLELTGRAWTEKVVGFLCAAGGLMSYMSVMSFANSLMLDFRCLIIPRFVYADGNVFGEEGIKDEKVKARIEELVQTATRLTKAISA